MFKIKHIIILAVLTCGMAYFLTKSPFSTSTITIESIESKTKTLSAVYNQIKWSSSPERDIWMMNQSHNGRHPDTNQWERLAIIIDKTKKPLTAKFYQLKPGPLEWNNHLINERLPYRASCFICHSNGPRAIRALNNSNQAPLSLLEQLKVIIWNFRIKTYGRIHYDKSHDVEDVTLFPPFHFSGASDTTELKVATCTHCHREDGWFARGALQRQQAGTIKHMVESGNMPPMGFSLSNSEKNKLRDFVRGF